MVPSCIFNLNQDHSLSEFVLDAEELLDLALVIGRIYIGTPPIVLAKLIVILDQEENSGLEDTHLTVHCLVALGVHDGRRILLALATTQHSLTDNLNFRRGFEA